jgi:amino acid transporter
MSEVADTRSVRTRSGSGPDGKGTDATPDVDLRRPEEDALHPDRKKFGTFGGVFTPTLLTILGVIMYLREGWVVGNAGILGGLLIILLAFGITILTALSMSSITTNIRIGAGGAYAIIAQSLGLEIGGALGIPRYLSQALAVTMYIFGFREGWLWIFPSHSPILVDLAVFLVLYAIAYKSAGLAIRVQYLIMAVIGASLLSIAAAAATGSMQYEVSQVGWWGDFPGAVEDGFQGTNFWAVFAVFFPASTGIMAGANMSGDLKDPKRSIPVGTLAAIGVSLVVYLLLAYWLARSATPDELVGDYTIMIERAYWGPPVLAGLLGATFSSALASIVGSARILQAMAEHRVVPGGTWLARRTPVGEPRNAMLVTGAVLLVSIMLRDLNAVAPLVTLFFLVTYAMLNGVLLLEQSLDLVSFRPGFRVPRIVPFLGLVGSLFAMFIIEPTLSWTSLAVVVAFYGLLLRRHLEAPFTDVRSGLFVSLAEWAAQKVQQLPGRQERAWKPNLLIPVEDVHALRGSFEVICDIVRPRGTIKLLGADTGSDPELPSRLADLARAFENLGVFTDWTVLETESVADGVVTGMQALRSTFFRPNILFLSLPEGPEARREARRMLAEAERGGLGALVYAPHRAAALGQRRHVNVWIRDRSPDWRISWDIGNLDLSLLAAYQLARSWNAELRLLMVVEDPSDAETARSFLEDLRSLARLHGAQISVETGSYDRYLSRAPQADVSVFGLLEHPEFGELQRLVERTRSTCLFVRDSGQESILA